MIIQELLRDLFTFNYCCIESVNQKELQCVLHQERTATIDDVWPSKQLKQK